MVSDIAYSGSSDLDIPAFLRKSVEGDEVGDSTQAEWLARLTLLLATVNDRLAHPDDLPAVILDLEAGPANLHLLLPLVEVVQRSVSTRVDAWVVLIGWADRQVDPSHRLSRHAARTTRALLSGIPEDVLETAMATLDARMEWFSVDGWIHSLGRVPSNDDERADGPQT